MKYETLNHLKPNEIQQIHDLVRQLSSSVELLSLSQFNEILSSDSLILFVARTEEGKICGMLTLVLFNIPTGLRARIEDVVVSKKFRRRGIARKLSEIAIKHFNETGARSLDLTSNPSRIEANKLYVSIGFELRETNVYRLSSA